MGRFFDITLHRPVPDARELRIVERLERSAEHGDIAALAAELGAELARGQAPSEPTLARIARAFEKREVDDGVRARFWQTLSERFPDHAYILACRGDALLYAGHEAEAMQAFLAAFKVAPALIDVFDDAADLARSLGGARWLEYQLAELRAALATAEMASLAGEDSDDPAAADDDDDDDDDGDGDDGDSAEIDVRERYSELLDEYRGDPVALAAIRALGHRISELEDAGVLPRSLVRRGDWRR